MAPVDGCQRLDAAPEKPMECLLTRLSDPAGRPIGVLRAAAPVGTALPAVERPRLLRTFANQIEARLSSAADAAILGSEAASPPLPRLRSTRS